MPPVPLSVQTQRSVAIRKRKRFNKKFGLTNYSEIFCAILCDKTNKNICGVSHSQAREYTILLGKEEITNERGENAVYKTSGRPTRFPPPSYPHLSFSLDMSLRAWRARELASPLLSYGK